MKNNNRPINQLHNHDILEMPFFKYRNNKDIQDLMKNNGNNKSHNNSKRHRSETSSSLLKQ